MSNTLLPCPFCGGAGTLWSVTQCESVYAVCQDCGTRTIDYKYAATAIAAWNRRTQPEITGNTSDGYHTFNELYHHRAMLFSVICNDRLDRAWKSKMHHDGTMYDGMFIVGIQTPNGQATYHYDIDPYWDMFRVPELPQAPEWDGHTPAQAIERIGRLTQPENKPLTNADRIRSMSDEELARWLVTDAYPHRVYCSVCYKTNVPNEEWLYEKNDYPKYCMWCGAKMESEGNQ